MHGWKIDNLTLQNLEMHHFICVHLIYDKGGIAVQWIKDIFFSISDVGTIGYPYENKLI